MRANILGKNTGSQPIYTLVEHSAELCTQFGQSLPWLPGQLTLNPRPMQWWPHWSRLSSVFIFPLLLLLHLLYQVSHVSILVFLLSSFMVLLFVINGF